MIYEVAYYKKGFHVKRFDNLRSAVYAFSCIDVRFSPYMKKLDI